MAENLTIEKNVSNITIIERGDENLGVSEAAYNGVLSGLGVLAAFTIIGNSVILIASKFTTAGQSATLVFIRSLCFADLVIGIFGIFKAIILNNVDNIMINCFLPESLFVSASTTLSLTFLWLNCDSYLRVTRPLSYGNSMDKNNIINSIMMVWNFAFILGFMPQMGWSRDEYTCNLFDYYDEAYIRLICSVWILCMIGSCILQYKLQKVRKQILEHSHLLSPESLEFRKFSKLIVTIRIDIITWISAYLPLLMYLLVYCNTCPLGGTKAANYNLFFFIPIFLIRSFLSAFIHSYRTIQIQQAMRNISRRLSSTVHKGSLSSEGGTTSNDSSNSNQSNPAISTVSNTASKLGIRAHRPLTITSSNVTIESSIEDIKEHCIKADSGKGHNCTQSRLDNPNIAGECNHIKTRQEIHPTIKALRNDMTFTIHQSDRIHLSPKSGVQFQTALAKLEKQENALISDLSGNTHAVSNMPPKLAVKAHKPLERAHKPLELTASVVSNIESVADETSKFQDSDTCGNGTDCYSGEVTTNF